MMITALFIFVFGVVTGSFINVLIFRTRREASVWKGRSKCMNCGKVIGVKDLVPILSFVLLKRRCRNCKSIISWQYPLVELISGTVLLFLYLRYNFGLCLPELASPNMDWAFFVRDSIFSLFLIIIFVYDLKYRLILDRFTIPAALFAFASNWYLGYPFWSLVLGALVLGSFFAAQYFLSKGKWVGGGDMRMGMMAGFMLGITQGLVMLFFAYLLGAVAGIYLILSGRAKMHTAIAFGTFLAIATFVTMIIGESVLDWYLSYLY